MALAPFHLHIDYDEPGRLGLQFDLSIGHRRILRSLSHDYFTGVRAMSMCAMHGGTREFCSAVEISEKCHGESSRLETDPIIYYRDVRRAWYRDLC